MRIDFPKFSVPSCYLIAICFMLSGIPCSAAAIAVPDAVTMHHLQKVRIPVLANDNGGVNALVVKAPRFGTAAVDSSGQILYTHTTGTPASDTFSYRATNAAGQNSRAEVSVTFATSLRIANHTLNVPTSPPWVSFRAIEAFPGLSITNPTCMASPPADTQRIFVCSKQGMLSVIPDVGAGTAASTTVLNLSQEAGGLFRGRVPEESLSTIGEQGLLGMAFHPDFATNGYIYIFYSVVLNGNTYERVSRITLKRPNSSAPTATLGSELVLIQQLDEASNHNGGDMHFGPDGYLYISLGDEGNQNDQFFNSQRIDKDFFSGLLRIDVNLEGSEIAGGNAGDPDDSNKIPHPHESIPLHNGKPGYEIPADNPFVGATSFNGLAVSPNKVRSEFWAVGLRNPWRFSFDGSQLWCGDVGGSNIEEVNLISRGGNYGWIYQEGTLTGPYQFSNPPHPAPPPGFTSEPPLYEYNHGSGPLKGNSITGGFVYRGTRIKSLSGKYIFADYVSGNVWSLTRKGANPPVVKRILGQGGISAFAPDPSNGDILMADLNGNRILRLSTVTNTTAFPQTLSATNLFSDLTDLSPAPGLLPYKVNLPFWSDHAVKRRWFIIPDTASKMTWSRDGAWTYPTGEIWVKHFDMPLVRSNPPAASDSPTPSKRVETRLLVKTATGSYGVSYRWNDEGTEATLAPDEGAEFNIKVTRNGTPYTQRWHIPSRAECSICHTPQAGHSLSMNTRQLNLSSPIHGVTANQIDLLKSGQYFSNTPESPNVLSRYLAPDDTGFPIEARVRSYLAVNCAYCHQANGTAAPANWDGRPQLTLAETGLINGIATNNGGSTLNKLVVPGDLTHSIVYNRVAVTNGFTRMPPLATSERDQKNIALLEEWIKFSARAGKPSQLMAAGDSSVPTAPLKAPTVISGISGKNFHLDFHATTNQSAQVETSTNLVDWTLWDVPGNQDLPQLGGPVRLEGPVSEPQRFFRIKLHDN